MKRLVLPVLFAALFSLFTGCSANDTPPPADGSNLPSEVQQYEARRQSEIDKKTPIKKPAPGK